MILYASVFRHARAESGRDRSRLVVESKRGNDETRKRAVHYICMRLNRDNRFPRIETRGYNTEYRFATVSRRQDPIRLIKANDADRAIIPISDDPESRTINLLQLRERRIRENAESRALCTCSCALSALVGSCRTIDKRIGKNFFLVRFIGAVIGKVRHTVSSFPLIFIREINHRIDRTRGTSAISANRKASRQQRECVPLRCA